MSGYARKMVRNQMRANRGLRERTVRRHEDLLRRIETVFVMAYRQSEEVDDRACHAAIESTLMGRPSHHPIAAMLAESLGQVRHAGSGGGDQAWGDALRVVAQSIRNHSSRQPGEVGYLAFVDMFIP